MGRKKSAVNGKQVAKPEDMRAEEKKEAAALVQRWRENVIFSPSDLDGNTLI